MCTEALKLLIQFRNRFAQQSYTLGNCKKKCIPFIFKNVFFNVSGTQIHLWMENGKWKMDTTEHVWFITIEKK